MRPLGHAPSAAWSVAWASPSRGPKRARHVPPAGWVAHGKDWYDIPKPWRASVTYLPPAGRHLSRSSYARGGFGWIKSSIAIMRFTCMYY